MIMPRKTYPKRNGRNSANRNKKAQWKGQAQ